MSTPTTAPAATRGPLTTKPVKNTLDGSTIVRATRSPQFHVLPAGETVTLCQIDVTKWSAQADVAEDAKVNCPPCVKAMRAKAAEAKAS
jgi:hypothetical protein